MWPHHPGTPVPTFAQLEKYCEKARSQGIDQIAITEHCHRFTRTVNEVMAHWARPRGGRVSEATDRILAAESGGDLATSGLVDVLAHLDVIKVGGHRPSRPAEHQDRLLRAVIDSGVVVEFSSAGLRKPIGETYPAIDALRELAAAGVGFTTASDAHVVDQIGMSYDRLRSMLAEVGVTELVSFRRRERIAHQLVLD